MSVQFAAVLAAIAATPEGRAAMVAALGEDTPVRTTKAPTRKAAAPVRKPAKHAAPKPMTAKQKAAAAKREEFVAWMKDTAEARAERKATNRELAAAMRKAGVQPTGDAWTAAKDALAEGADLATAVQVAQAIA